MSSGRRIQARSGFGRQSAPVSESGVPAAIIKQGRKSGQLNLSNRSLTEVPDTVWRINIDTPEECRNIAMDNDERWWDQVDLTKLILASNLLTNLTDGVQLLPALTVLDVHDNRLTLLPDVLGSLSNLQKLVASHNQLLKLPSGLAQMNALQSLHIEYNQIAELPAEIGDLSSLEDLDISHNKLQALPSSVGNLSRCMKFNMSNNHVKCLPHDMGFMTALRVLDGTHNQIHTLPDELGNLTHLEQLYLRHNRIAHLPLLENCSNLKELHLGNNALHDLTAEQLESIVTVSFLDLRDNKISKLPDEITILQNLERLDISNNNLSTLPYQLGTVTKLKSIVLDGNPMKTIRRDIIMRGTNELKKYLCSRLEEPRPNSAGPARGVRDTKGSSGIIGGAGEGLDSYTIHNTKTLDYSGKKASHIPEDVWSVSQTSGVGVVNLSKNALTDMPPQVSSLHRTLTELYLGFNKLTSLPDTIGELKQLLMLDVRNNQLTSLPSSLANLKRIRELVISVNRLRELPAVVYQLHSLEILLVGDNQVQTVDAGALQAMTMLATLDLQNNDIMQVPPELGLCTQLRSLQLEGNPFRHPRPAILTKGTLSLLEFLRDRIPNLK